MASRQGIRAAAEPAPGAALDAALQKLVQCLTPTPESWSKRQALVRDHIKRLQQHWKTSHDIRICPFGSSLSGLCLADSDIDLGLFGVMHGVELQSITSSQAKKLLYSILSSLHRAHLVHHGTKVQAVMGARVPVLKYKCALSGLDCDISIQGSGALLKASCMAILNQHCPALSPLYRLVKLWAAAHDLNDAARSTFNSTSLLYLAVFFLQSRQLVPPIQELVEPALLNDPTRRPLCEPNKWLWDHPEHLRQLLAAAEHRMVAWVNAQQRQRGQAWSQHSLGELLHGFFAFYSSLFTDWATGKRRSVYADLWGGQLSSSRPEHEQLGKDYLFNLQDPFDPQDCPARAIGTVRNDNNGVAVLIAYLLTCSCSALTRYHGSDGCSGSAAGSSSCSRDCLCQCLAWLFGPQGVLHLATRLSGSLTTAALAESSSGASSGAVGGASSSHEHCQEWWVCPFSIDLAAELQRRQLQQQHQQHQHGGSHGRGRRDRPETLGSLFRWLVSNVHAALEPPDQGPCVLCLEHLSLLNKRIEAGALDGVLGAALAASAADRRAAQQQQRQQLEESRQRWQQRLLPGPPLPQADAQLLRVYGRLAAVLNQQRWQPRQDGKRRNPASHPKPVKDAARDAVTQVALRLQALAAPVPAVQHQHLGEGAAAGAQLQDTTAAAAAAEDDEDEAEGIGGYGLLAVLQQHGFLQLFEQWCLTQQDGTLWAKLLPLPEHLKHPQQLRHVLDAAGAVGADAAAGAAAGASDALQQAHGTPNGRAAPHDHAPQLGATGGGADGAAGVAVSSRAFLQQLLSRQSQQQASKQHQQQPGMQEQQYTLSLQLEVQLTTHSGMATSPPAACSLLPTAQQKRTQIQHKQHKQHQQQPEAVRVVPRPHGSRGAAAAVPMDQEPAGAAPLAMHGDGLAERYCRQLQQQLGSSPAAAGPAHQAAAQAQQQPGKQRTRGKQKHQASEPPHPAAVLLKPPGPEGASSSAQGLGSTPAAAASAGSGAALHRRLQKASYTVQQLQQRVAKAEGQVAARREEEERAQQTIQRLMAAAGPAGESALSVEDRQALIKAKQAAHKAAQALQSCRVNLEQAQQKLPHAQRDLAAAEAAVAAAEAAGQ